MENKDKIELLRRVLAELGLDKGIFCEKVSRAIDSGISAFMNNPYFAEEYESIPTDKLRCYELLTWANSVGTNVIVNDMQATVKDALDVDEWQWHIDHTPNVTAKICWSRILKAKHLDMDFVADENIQYYYLEDISKVGKELRYVNDNGVELSSYYLYQMGKGWIDDCCEISDRKCGYDPTEDDFYKFGNTEIMATLHKISAAEAIEMLKKNI